MLRAVPFTGETEGGKCLGGLGVGGRMILK